MANNENIQKELTKDQAVALVKTNFWGTMSFRDRAVFQMNQKYLCMPMGVFHEAMEKALNRPVLTHEFGLNWKGLKAELMGEQSPPTIQDIINLIPADKRTILLVPQKERDNHGKVSSSSL